MSKKLSGALKCAALFCLLGTVYVRAGENMVGSQSQNEGLLVVPKVSDVTIDGKLDDWDFSGRIWSFADKAVRQTYSTETAAMWDKDALYVAVKWKDATPMFSTIDPAFDPNDGWRSDAIQMRIATPDQTSWLTTWYFTPHKQPVLHRAVWKDPKDSRKGTTTEIFTNPSGGPDLGQGVQMAYRANEAGDGYVQEMRIPWKLIYASPPDVKAGMTVKIGLEFIWGDVTGRGWPAHRYADNLQPGKTSREFFWTARDDWGDFKLVDKNHVAVRQYVDDSSRLAGAMPIRFELPVDAQRVSLAIDDASGQRVRNIGGLDPADYTVSSNDKTRTIEVPWDGLTDSRTLDGPTPALGNLVPPSSYRVRALYHTGLHAKYEMCFYNPGTPPWQTMDGHGTWGADHTPPLRVAKAGDGMILSWQFAEGGSGTIGLDNAGKKIWGEKRGGYYLAADDQYVYAVPDSWYIKEEVLVRLDRKTGKYAPFAADGKELPFELPTRTVFANNVPGKIVGMAVCDKQLALAMSGGELVLLDKQSAQIQKRIPLAGVGRIAFSKDGKLYALVGGAETESKSEKSVPSVTLAHGETSGGKVHEIDIDAGTSRAIDMPGLVTPSDLCVDNDGNILVTDIGPDSQVKAYSPDSKLQYTCGVKGGRPIRGKFDPQAMMHMSSVAVDQAGQVWVVESWNYPRRVSVWGRDGKLVRDYMGNTGYAGTGAYLHETDPTLGYVGPLEFKLNKADRTWTLNQILWVPDEAKGERFNIETGTHTLPQRFDSSASGQPHKYLFSPPFRPWQGYVFYMERDGKGWQPVSAITLVGQISGKIDDKGLVAQMPDGDFAGLDPYDVAFWNDRNQDGIAQRNECEIVPATKPAGGVGKKGTQAVAIGSGWGGRVRTSDFAFYADGLTEFKPNGFADDGAPIYTPARMRTLDVKGRGDLVPVPGDSTLLVLQTSPTSGKEMPTFTGVDTRNGGTPLWSYPNPYPGVHGSHKATMPKPGLLIGPLKVTGVAEVNDQVGKVVHVRGNLGQDFLFTSDGIYIDSMFQDTRLPNMPLPATEDQLAGMTMEGFTQGGEPFNGWFGKQSDGVIRLTSGIPGQACMIMDVAGLENIRRLPEQVVTVDRNLAAKFEADYNTRVASMASANAAASEYVIAKATAKPVIDAKANDWKDIKPIRAAREGSAESAAIRLSYDDQNLYALYEVKDATPWRNEGRDFLRLFKTGDTVDLQLSATANRTTTPVAGDVRLMIGQLNDKPTAVIMKPVAPGSPAGDAHTYVSPVQPRKFDQVAILSDAQVQVKRGDGQYVVEVAIPWSSVGIQPKAGLALRGDVGFTGSNTEGTITVSRTYWSNRDTNLVNDEPSEAWLKPSGWGSLRLGQ